MKHMKVLFGSLLISFVYYNTFAQTPSVSDSNKLIVSKGKKSDEVYSNVEKRFALVIGESDYSTEPKLPVSLNDADDMELTLVDAGFDVVKIVNKTKAEIDMAISLSAQYYETNKYDVALIYFSGHGAQYANIQMLAPIEFQNASVTGKDELTNYLQGCIRLPELVKKFNISQTKCILGIIDACRDSSYVVDENKSMQYQPEVNALFRANEGQSKLGIFYSTSFGKLSTAKSIDGKHSLFTTFIINNLKSKVTTFDALIRQVQSDMKPFVQTPVANPSYFEYQFQFFNNPKIASSPIIVEPAKSLLVTKTTIVPMIIISL